MLTAAAPTGGAVVAITVPSKTVTRSTTGTITATGGGVAKTATLTVTWAIAGNVVQPLVGAAGALVWLAHPPFAVQRCPLGGLCPRRN